MKKKFNILANEWLSYQKFLVKESTYSNYYDIVNNHVIPYLGNEYCKNIDKKKIISFNQYLLTEGNKKNNKGLSNKTVKDINIILKQILNHENISINVKIPKVIPKEIKVMSKEDYLKLQNYCLCNLNTYTLGILICMYTGLRIGEICALKWENIDLDKGIIYVRSTIQRIKDFNSGKSKILISSPKTSSSFREIPIINFLLPLLKKFKNNNDYYVITNKIKYIEPRGYYLRYQTILNKLNMNYYNFHCLRHTFATKCAELGVDAKSLSELLGHSNVKTTLTLYVHPSMDAKKTYMDKLYECN